jgi:hypothetical protein
VLDRLQGGRLQHDGLRRRRQTLPGDTAGLHAAALPIGLLVPVQASNRLWRISRSRLLAGRLMLFDQAAAV